MLSSSFRKSQAVLFGFAMVFSTYIAINILEISWATVSLPTSDYFSVFARYLDYSEGKINLVSYIFSKHIDHNHAFAYLLSLIDISVDDGRLRLLHWTQIASHFAVYGLMVYVVLNLAIPISVKSVVLLFISSQIFAIQGAETWIFPFQVVLASFRLLFVVGLFLYCREIISSPHPQQRVLLWALLLLLTASMSHGSGILIFALLFTLCGFWGNRRVTYQTLGFFSIYLLHEAVFPSNTSLITLVTRIPIRELLSAPYYLSLLLGNSFAWGAPFRLQVVVGAIGIAFWVALLWKFLEGGKKTWSDVSHYKLFFLAFSAFSLAGGGLSVLLNLSYMELRGVALPPPPEYFLASRYLITTSGFWIGTAVVGMLYLPPWKRLVFSLILVISATTSVMEGRFDEPNWKRMVENHKFGEIVASTDSWGFVAEPLLKEMLYLPPTFPITEVSRVLLAQEKQQLGPYAPQLVALNQQYALASPASFSDGNWERGIAKMWAGFIVLNLPANRSRLIEGKKIRFINGETRTISKRNESGMYLNIYLAGQPLDGLQIGFPNKFEVME